MLVLSKRVLFSMPRSGVSPLFHRSAYTDVQRPPGSPKTNDDPRPPWVYVASRLGSFTVIPFIAVYAVFVYDWGDHEHVFSPPRRWLASLKTSFFTLSPAEERLLEGGSNSEVRVTRVSPESFPSSSKS